MSLKELVNTINAKALPSGDILIQVIYKVSKPDTLDRVLVASEIGSIILEQINRPDGTEWTADKIMAREG